MRMYANKKCTNENLAAGDRNYKLKMNNEKRVVLFILVLSRTGVFNFTLSIFHLWAKPAKFPFVL